MTKKIIIVDDHVLIANSLKSVLESGAQFEVVALVEDGLAVMDAFRQHQPDLVIMDINMPKMNGIEAIHLLKKRWSDIHVLVLSARTEEVKVREALDAGAQGYILKRSTQDELFLAIEQVLRGKTFIDPNLELTENDTADPDKIAAVHLTARERQVLQLIIEGYKNREIAEHLHISLKTVESHRTHLMKKVDAHSVSELLQAARRLGFLQEE